MEFNLEFLEALSALEEGKMVARKHWLEEENGPMFAVLLKDKTIKREFIDSDIVLPDSLKQYIKNNCEGDLEFQGSFHIFHVNSNTLCGNWEPCKKRLKQQIGV